jgi:hypothetical protein
MFLIPGILLKTPHECGSQMKLLTKKHVLGRAF